MFQLAVLYLIEPVSRCPSTAPSSVHDCTWRTCHNVSCSRFLSCHPPLVTARKPFNHVDYLRCASFVALSTRLNSSLISRLVNTMSGHSGTTARGKGKAAESDTILVDEQLRESVIGRLANTRQQLCREANNQASVSDVNWHTSKVRSIVGQS